MLNQTIRSATVEALMRAFMESDDREEIEGAMIEIQRRIGAGDVESAMALASAAGDESADLDERVLALSLLAGGRPPTETRPILMAAMKSAFAGQMGMRLAAAAAAFELPRASVAEFATSIRDVASSLDAAHAALKDALGDWLSEIETKKEGEP